MSDTGIAFYGDAGTMTPELVLFVGEWQIATDSAPSLAAFGKYEIVALTATGLTPFITGTHVASQAVITTIAATAAAQRVPYWNSGKFNWKALILPAGTALDTLDELKAYFNGSNLQFAHTI